MSLSGCERCAECDTGGRGGGVGSGFGPGVDGNQSRADTVSANVFC